MINHETLALERMEAAENYRQALKTAHRSRPKTPETLAQIASLNEDLRHTLTLAKLHTNLAQVQAARAQVGALEDLRAEVERLVEDLTAPMDRAIGRAISTPLRSVETVELPEHVHTFACDRATGVCAP